jgi:uncharacterized phage protein (TIGR01671 family)
MEIKFRYMWQNKWYYVDFYKDNLAEFFRLFEIRAKTTRFQQFTGIRDKNLKEIYEGDIVTTSGYGNVKVIFEDGKFGVYIQEMKGFEEPELTDIFYDLNTENNAFFWSDGEEINNYLEVIGNIFENPELLEDKD